MNIYIVIPAHNEGAFLEKTLTSLANQTLTPKQIVVVNDNSTDDTATIAREFQQNHKNITLINTTSGAEHRPGSKVIEAFYKGFETLDNDFDIICKFDADLIFPNHYLETIARIFKSTPKTGMVSGILHIQKEAHWEYENIADKNHVRGPIKAYSKGCFEAIGGLKKSIGWDTVDVLLTQYHGWNVKTDSNLVVKHLKPTGKTYHKSTKYLQGEALYKMRYGIWITIIAAAKMGFRKRQISLFFNYIKGYFLAKRKQLEFLVTREEGKFIRRYRWKKILEKLT